MKEQHISTAEERRSQLTALLASEHQGSMLALRIDVEMRLLLAQYDVLKKQHVQLLEEKSYHDYEIRRILTVEQTIQAKLEFAGDLLDIDRTVIAACVSTVSLHHVAHGESSFEHGYPLLRDYFTGDNTLLFKHLGFFTKEEIFQLLGIGLEGRGEA